MKKFFGCPAYGVSDISQVFFSYVSLQKIFCRLLDLARMFRLFQRVKGGLHAVCECLRKYLREQGVGLVKDDETGEQGKSAITYVQVC